MDGRTDGRTDRRTDGRTDGRSDCTPRPAFAFGDAGKNQNMIVHQILWHTLIHVLRSSRENVLPLTYIDDFFINTDRLPFTSQ